MNVKKPRNSEKQNRLHLEVLLFKDSMKNLLFNERKDSLRHPIV